MAFQHIYNDCRRFFTCETGESVYGSPPNRDSEDVPTRYNLHRNKLNNKVKVLFFMRKCKKILNLKTKLRVLVSNEYGIQLLYIKQLEKHRSLIFTLLNFTK